MRQVVGGLSIAQAKSLAQAGLRASVISGNLGLPDGNARYNLPPAEIQRLVADFIRRGLGQVARQFQLTHYRRASCRSIILQTPKCAPTESCDPNGNGLKAERLRVQRAGILVVRANPPQHSVS